MKYKQFIKTACTFLIGNVLSRLVSFFLLPLYTSKIAPEQFGSYDLVVSFVSLIVPIAFFQIWDGMYRFAFDYKEDGDKQRVISNSTLVCGFGLIVFLGVFSLLQIYFKFDYFGYILAYGVVYGVQYQYTYAARVYLKNKLIVLSGLISTILSALANILLICVFGWDIKAIYFSAVFSYVVQILIIECSVGVIRNFKLRAANKALIKSMIRFSVPLCVATVSYWLLSGLTKLFIQNMVGDAGNGLYAVANKFCTIVTMLVSILQFAWNESAYLMMEDDEEEKKRSYAKCINVMILGVLVGAAIICLGIKIIFPYFIDEQYGAALELIPASVIGVAVNSLAGFMGTLFMAEKKNNFIMVSTFISATLNIGLGYLGTKYLGLQGAVIVLAISFTLLFVLRLGKLWRIYAFRLDVWKILVSSGLLVGAVVCFFVSNSIWIDLVACFVSGLIFLFFFKEQIQTILKSMKKK